jgi:hypothetical protein
MIRLLFFLAAVYGDRLDIVIPRKKKKLFMSIFSLSLSSFFLIPFFPRVVVEKIAKIGLGPSQEIRWVVRG